jgi:t-SNARE complex subunit (syntaxin)
VNIKDMGIETHQLLQGANKELREQREVIINVSDKTKDIRKNLNLADKKINEMSKREFIKRVAMYSIMFLLLGCIILTIFLKLFG